MKKPQVDLTQLKVEVGAKLKSKHGPLSPTSTSSPPKKRVTEKENSKAEPSYSLPRKGSASASASDPKKGTLLPPISLAPEVERVEAAGVDSSIIPV